MDKDAKGATQPDQDADQSAIGEAEAIESLEKMVVTGDEPEKATEAKDETPPEEAETEESTDEEDETDEESEGEDAESEESEDEPKAHTGQRAEKRIHKLTAQRNEAREKVEALEKQNESLRSIAESGLSVGADYLTPSEATAIRAANEMIERKEFLMSHIGVGYEDEKDESKSLTPKQIAEELVKIDRRWDEVVEARKTYAERKRQMLEDMKAGRTLRLSKQALAKAGKKPAPAVKSAAAASQSAARGVATAGSSRRGQSAERFAKAGKSEEAALRELEELIA